MPDHNREAVGGRRYRLGGRVVSPGGTGGVVIWVEEFEGGEQRLDARLDDSRSETFLSSDDGWRPVDSHAPATALGAPSSKGWRPQRSAAFAPSQFGEPEEAGLDSALDRILERARRRYESASESECQIRQAATCRNSCDCRKCFTHFYYADAPPGGSREACAAGPECSRFRDLHTVVHTASAAKHTALMLEQASTTGFLDPAVVFANRDAVIASYGCGGAADLVGCLAWATSAYEAHSASSATLRGCDLVAGWFDQGSEAVANAVGDKSPWTGGVYLQFSAAQRVPSDADLMMLEDAEIVSLSWVLSILDQEDLLEAFWPRLVSRLRPGAIVLVSDRWQPDGFNRVLSQLLDSTPALLSAWGVGDYDQKVMDYQFSPEVRQHLPRGKYRASGAVARVR